MMAFFMVMWIVGLDDSTRRSVEEYFSRAVGIAQGNGGGASPLSVGHSPSTATDSRIAVAVRSSEQSNFLATAERLRQRLDSLDGPLGAANVEVTVGDDGLRIELIESGSGDQFFPRGGAGLRPAGVTILALIASEVVKLTNPVVIEGHTDAAVYTRDAGYTNWELSADRANAARRMILAAGIPSDRIAEVRGLADTRLRNPADPFASENRRISLLLPFTPTARTSLPAPGTPPSPRGAAP
jgi:chemotaxis protein MotB